MAQSIDLIITAGLPYARRIRVAGAANIWPVEADFEVRSQIRVDKAVSSTLKGSLTSYLTAAIDNDDIVVDLEMTGLQTRLLPAGYYDIILSDVGVDDARAIPILSGQIKLRSLVTAPND